VKKASVALEEAFNDMKKKRKMKHLSVYCYQKKTEKRSRRSQVIVMSENIRNNEMAMSS